MWPNSPAWTAWPLGPCPLAAWACGQAARPWAAAKRERRASALRAKGLELPASARAEVQATRGALISAGGGAALKEIFYISKEETRKNERKQSPNNQASPTIKHGCPYFNRGWLGPQRNFLHFEGRNKKERKKTPGCLATTLVRVHFRSKKFRFIFYTPGWYKGCREKETEGDKRKKEGRKRGREEEGEKRKGGRRKDKAKRRRQKRKRRREEETKRQRREDKKDEETKRQRREDEKTKRGREDKRRRDRRGKGAKRQREDERSDEDRRDEEAKKQGSKEETKKRRSRNANRRTSKQANNPATPGARF